MSLLRKLGATALVQALLALATFAVFDTIAFFTLSDDFADNFPTYREGYWVPDFIGRGYPKDYYVANAERGFDIKPTAVPRTDQFHVLDDVGITYPVWSNQYGCFDTPHPSPAADFVYFAGDSIVWGYAPFETKFGTVYERESGVETFKCGVTHTGQRHQFSKFLEIGRKLGRWPAKVVVFYSPTDVANDYLHPHSTVIDGGLADNARLDADNNIVRLDQGWFDMLRRRIADGRAGESEHPPFHPIRSLMKYSFTLQLVNAGLYYVRNHVPVVSGYVPVLGEEPLLHWADKYEIYRGQKLYDLHRLVYLESRSGKYRYRDYPYAEANKKVLREWRAHAAASGYELIVVILPAGDMGLTEDGTVPKDFYSELKEFLKQNDIHTIDLGEELEKRKIDPASIYWEGASHFSIDGNILVGEILTDLL
ncbi:MAG: hypothetical protein AB7S92_01655 [Parvibaculaceae bacterium]